MIPQSMPDALVNGLVRAVLFVVILAFVQWIIKQFKKK